MIDISSQPSGKFWDALSEAEVGTPIVYHIGLHCGGSHRRDARDAYERGLVTLVQKRNGPGNFIYIAQKIEPRKKK